MRHNTTHAGIILDASITEKKTDDSELTIENINVPATPAKENKHQLNRVKKNNQEKDKNQNKEHKNEKSVVELDHSMVKYLNGWEMSKKIKDCQEYVRSFPSANTKCIDDYKKPSMRDKPDHFILHVGTS